MPNPNPDPSQVRGRGALNAFCERHGVYEVLTQELVAALAAHIRARLPALQEAAGGGGEHAVVILEVADNPNPKPKPKPKPKPNQARPSRWTV